MREIVFYDSVLDHSDTGHRPECDGIASSIVGDAFYGRDMAAEIRTVVTKMPPAVKVTDGTYEGYAYSIHNDFGDEYDLLIYYDPRFGVYRVALLSPMLGEHLDPHGVHLHHDGVLDLPGAGGWGYPSMEQTFANSVLWTLGASAHQRGLGFPFNSGEEGKSRA